MQLLEQSGSVLLKNTATAGVNSMTGGKSSGRGALTTMVVMFLALLFPAAGADVYAAVMDTLAGPLPREIAAAGGPYLVIEDIDVPIGKTVTIEPGTVFLFRNFAGLHAQGRLLAEGTREKPIVFTSEFDRKHNPVTEMYPNPYDWNGIYFHTNSIGSNLSHCQVHYSVYGIISETKFIRVSPAAFYQNGKSNLVIEGKELLAEDGQYRYELSVKDATVDGVPVRILRDPKAPARNALRYSSLGAMLGGISAGVIYAVQWNDAQRRLTSLSQTDNHNLMNNTGKEWLEAQNERDRTRAYAVVTGILGAIGAVGFSWSFTF